MHVSLVFVWLLILLFLKTLDSWGNMNDKIFHNSSFPLTDECGSRFFASTLHATVDVSDARGGSDGTRPTNSINRTRLENSSWRWATQQIAVARTFQSSPGLSTFLTRTSRNCDAHASNKQRFAAQFKQSSIFARQWWPPPFFCRSRNVASSRCKSWTSQRASRHGVAAEWNISGFDNSSGFQTSFSFFTYFIAASR